MDPDGTLYDLLDSLNDGDRDAAIEYLADLSWWLIHDGVLPNAAEAVARFQRKVK